MGKKQVTSLDTISFFFGLERKAEERGEQRSKKKDEDEKKEGRKRTRKGLLSNENQKLVFCEVCLHLFL